MAAVLKGFRGDAGFQLDRPVARETDLCIELEHLGARGLGLLAGAAFSLGRAAEVVLSAGELAGKGCQFLHRSRNTIGRCMSAALRFVRECLGFVRL